ncbi:MAG: patatin-like phospholipase family protein [Bacteroidia bacterium]|nr:patatin-like phospholipase family protein [Bacteroidia bacterium]
MKREIIIALLTVFSLFVNAEEFAKRPKIGLVLSGGGAKGFAHVGALKVIEEAGIPVDYITGTSVGSIVGGLYALGYDASMLENVIEKQNWKELLSNSFKREYIPAIIKEEQSRYLISLPIETRKISLPAGLLNGQNLMELFTYLSYGYHDVTDFSKLPVPFECIAADIATGEEVVLNKGFLPKAIRASMAVPAAIAACEIDGRMLVDGGIVNNFPVDRCREMGANIIIGIDIGDDLLTRDKIRSITDVISQLSSLMSIERSEKNRKNVDILIKPDISGFSATSFDTESAKVLMKRGEDAARKMLPQLIRMRDSLGIDPVIKNKRELPDDNESVIVNKIEVEGTDKTNIVSFLGKMGIGNDKKVTLQHIRQGISRIYAAGNYESVDFKISGGIKKTINILVKESSTKRLNVGLHYDTDLKASALINTTLYSDRISGSNLSLDAKLSSFPMFSARYSLDRGWKPGFTGAGSFTSDRIWGYENGRKASEINVSLINFQIATQAVISDAFKISLGASFENFHFGTIIGQPDISELKNATFYNYFAKVKIDEFDKPYFPVKGWALDGNFKLVTDNGLNYNGKSPVPLLGFTLKGARQITDRLVFLPSFYSQFTFASFAPVYYRSYVGGTIRTNYFGVFLPFAGLRRMQLSADNVALIRLDLRMRMWQKVFVSLNPNIGIYGDRLSLFSAGNFMFGGGFSIAYDSMVGPIEFNLGTSNLNQKITAFFSLGYTF